jgi:AcrR family transcriptional regulator
MPKIVDREERKRELARQAVPVFRAHGYEGLGMRRIAEELGMSKSALYHYFPSKEALFAACTAWVTKHATDVGDAEGGLAITDPDAPAAEIIATIGGRLAPEFAGELSLMVDYLRGRSADDVAADPTMQLANRHFLETFEAIVGPDHARPLVCLVYGWLLQRWFDGQQTSVDDLREWCTRWLDGH